MRSFAKLSVASLFLIAMPVAASAAPTAKADVPSARAAIAAAQAIPTGGIQELKAIEIGGIKQWISVRGRNPDNPILLFIHGGPGSPMMPESWAWQRPWEDYFTVVQWDQRGAGKTFSAARRKLDPSMTIDRMQADAEEVIAYLERTYNKKKIFLMGHSWGSVLGLRVAAHRPDLLYAYIGVGQVVNGVRNEQVGYAQTLAQAEKLGNQQAVKELKALAPYPDTKGPTPLTKVMTERKWDVALGGMVYGKSHDDADLLRAASPDYTDYDVASAQTGELLSAQTLLPAVAHVDFDNVRQFKCPIFIFAGADDRTTPESVAKAYFDTIQAPKKKFFKIERAAHYVVSEAPGEVLVDLVRDVRPLSQGASAP